MPLISPQKAQDATTPRVAPITHTHTLRPSYGHTAPFGGHHD